MKTNKKKLKELNNKLDSIINKFLEKTPTTIKEKKTNNSYYAEVDFEKNSFDKFFDQSAIRQLVQQINKLENDYVKL